MAAKGEYKYSYNERVSIVGGVYKHFGSGTFIRYAGNCSADVKVDKDSVSERCIRLTSIAPMKTEPSVQHNNRYILVPREEIEDAVKALGSIPANKKLETVICKMEKLLVTDEDDEIRVAGNWKQRNNTEYYKMK